DARRAERHGSELSAHARWDDHLLSLLTPSTPRPPLWTGWSKHGSTHWTIQSTLVLQLLDCDCVRDCTGKNATREENCAHQGRRAGVRLPNLRGGLAQSHHRQLRPEQELFLPCRRFEGGPVLPRRLRALCGGEPHLDRPGAGRLRRALLGPFG